MRPLLLLVALAACSSDFDDTDSSSDDLAAASSFDHDGVNHHAQTIKLAHGSAQLRDLDGNPIGKTVTGSIRMQGIEAIDSPIGTLYYTWGDGQPSGHIHVSDLAKRPAIDDSARAGNGEACAIGSKSYWVRPARIEGDLRYRGPTTGDSYSLAWYGTPGSPVDDYTYLSWSWIDRAGGGIVRAVVRENDVFYPCAVKSIKTESIATAGWVKAIYGMVQSNGHRYFGWLVHSHQYESQPVVMHVALRSS